MDKVLLKKIKQKIDETISKKDEIKQLVNSLSNIDDSKSFAMGIIVGRLYNAFYYQSKRILNREPTKDEFNEFCNSLAEKISSKNVRVDIDDRNDSIGKRIREAEKEWIRYILVIGEKEVNSSNLSIRDRRTGNVRELSFEEFSKEFDEQTHGKPFLGLNMPKYLSKRPQLMV